ncbi:MAG: hypothetical protein ACI35S_05310 [Anaeroplasma sp.]
MATEQYIRSLLAEADPKRGGQWRIEGQHPFLNEWIEWYSGNTSWHLVECIKEGQKAFRKRMSTGIAKLIAEEWASNYANEDTKITISKDDKMDAAIQKILKKEKVFSKFGNFVEKFMALGVGATVIMPSKIEVTQDGKINPSNAEVKISFLDAPRIIPITVDDGVCTECAFIKYSTNTCTLQIHILVNDKYEIHEVVGTNVGGTSGGYNFNYSDRKVLKLNTNIPLFQIWHPNIVDNKIINNQLGTSIYSDALDWFKVVDTIFDSFHIEFKNGAKKRYISTELQYIDADGNLSQPLLNDEDLYIPKGQDGKTMLQEFNAELRVDSHIKALSFAINIAAAKCGMGDSKFRFDGTGEPMQTATGVRAKQTTFHRNILKQENLAADRFRKMLLAIQYVNNNFTTAEKLNFEEDNIEVVFDDNIVEDTSTKKTAELQEVQAGIMSIAEFRSHWYDEDYDSALAFLQENAMLVAPYSLVLQSGLMTPEMFVDKVYGSKCPNKEELIEYITESLGRTESNSDYDDEYDVQDNDQLEDDDSLDEKENKDDE